MTINRKVVNILLITAMLLAIIVISVIFKSSEAGADTAGSPGTAPINSAEFVIDVNQYFVNDQTPGIGMDAAPYIDSSSERSLVPVRYLGDALGATTAWDAGSQAVTVTGGSASISMIIGSATMMVNGKAQTLDQAPVINDGRTYLPSRWVANALGYQVDWNAANQIVIIWPNGTTEPGIVGTVKNGFVMPTGTKLTLDNTGDINGTTEPMAFVINTKLGDVQGQLADAQYILSQATFLDPATVSKVMAVINSDMAGTTNEDGYINSSNGGGIDLSSYGNWWFGVQISTKPAHSGLQMLK